jgi:UDP-apiose/xylose synthase
VRQGKLIILGCGGFVGSHLIDRILAVTAYRIEGWDVAFDKIAHHLGHDRLGVHQRYRDAEVTFNELAPLIEEVDALISLAAVCIPASYVASPLRTIRSNFIDAY